MQAIAFARHWKIETDSRLTTDLEKIKLISFFSFLFQFFLNKIKESILFNFIRELLKFFSLVNSSSINIILKEGAARSQFSNCFENDTSQSFSNQREKNETCEMNFSFVMNETSLRQLSFDGSSFSRLGI